jgi:hypothetical protein
VEDQIDALENRQELRAYEAMSISNQADEHKSSCLSGLRPPTSVTRRTYTPFRGR